MNTIATLEGLFKEVYANEHKPLIPVGKVVQERVQFSKRDKELGNRYHLPVVLAHEHGVTFEAPGQGGLTNLNAAVAGQVKDAIVDAYAMTLRSHLSYEAAARAVKSRNAFIDATRFLVGNMFDSITKKLEIELLYGQSGLAKIASASGSVPTMTATIEDAEWADGIWVGAENMLVDVYNGGTFVTSGRVQSVNIAAKQIVITDLTAAIAAGHDIYFKGAYGNEMAGIHKILSQSTGNLFNISVTAYALWKGTVHQANATPIVLSFPIINQAISAAMPKGMDGDAFVLVNPKHWDDLLEDVAGLRMFDSSYSPKQGSYGHESLVFHSQNGKIEIVASPYVKEGYSYILSLKDWVRIGASEVTFKRPGIDGDERIFFDMPERNAYEFRAYTSQSIFCGAPARSVLITNLKAE
ncbi:MAG: hypothetical protein ABIM30_01170 [candidate division WOR-3 bacterium]